ncbi:hypothetical protein ES288_D11G240400v1 [Gossypium darwinii]|uniref:C3H1-type domain-containing protein n=1 Tax=Gossypium darwinii TaxID=34276 RepID=A0A5D2AP83_GOSDA|nr:hypothetical protein ES288_D11G240400v1 [Gossypium darwinii]
MLPSIAAVDLSHNMLTGTIHSNFENCSTLENFNVSYNLLTGPIPLSGPIFPNLHPSSFSGNDKLYGRILPKLFPFYSDLASSYGLVLVIEQVSERERERERQLNGSTPKPPKVLSHSLLFSQLPYFLLFIHMFMIADLCQTSVPPFSKGVCNRFLNTGFFQYRDNCKYFHPNNDSRTPNPPLSTVAPSVFFSVCFINSYLFMQCNASGVEGNGNGMAISWGNLPPSLKPPPKDGYPPLPFVDWG